MGLDLLTGILPITRPELVVARTYVVDYFEQLEVGCLGASS